VNLSHLSIASLKQGMNLSLERKETANENKHFKETKKIQDN